MATIGSLFTKVNQLPIEQFYQSVEPVSRGDGSDLQEGDLWYDSSTGRQWIRKGIYWVGEELLLAQEQQMERCR